MTIATPLTPTKSTPQKQSTQSTSAPIPSAQITEFELQGKTSDAWVEAVMNDFDRFLLDHAACEKKAAGMAVSMISHYPDKPQLVLAMSELAVEEMMHFRECIKLIHDRGQTLTRDEKDPYITALRDFVSQGKQAYFLDRLLMASVVEARGAERFALVAAALAKKDDPKQQKLSQFYSAIAKSEARHYTLFLDLAQLYFNPEEVSERLQQWLTFETSVMDELAIRPALH